MSSPAVFQYFLALLIVCWCAVAGAQIPHKINYQGLLTNSGNAPIDGMVSMSFKLFDVLSGGSPLYTEQQTVNVTNGAFSVVIGSVTALPLPFDVQYYLGVTVGTDPEMTPRSPLAAAPYAIRAGVANNLDTLGPGDVQRRVAGICNGSNAIQTINANGTVGCVAVGTGVTSIAGDAPITASASTGGVTIGATVGTTAGTLAAGDHGHNMACGYRTANAFSATSVSVSCSAGEVLTGGGCNTDSAIVDSYPFQSCPPGTTCFCAPGSRCPADSWSCTRSGGTSLIAYGMCCDRPIRGNVP